MRQRLGQRREERIKRDDLCLCTCVYAGAVTVLTQFYMVMSGQCVHGLENCLLSRERLNLVWQLVHCLHCSCCCGHSCRVLVRTHFSVISICSH